MNHIPSNLRLLRTNMHKTQDEVAKDLFVTRQTISNYEVAKSEPTIDMLNAFCDYYRVGLEELVNTDLSKKRKSKLVVFDSVIFDKKEKEMIILNDSKNIYDYRDIVKVSIVNHDAKYRNKDPECKHVILQGVTTMSLLSEPSFYVALKVEMMHDEIALIYVSKEKTVMNTDLYFKDKEKAIEIKEYILKIIDKYHPEVSVPANKRKLDRIEVDNKRLTKMSQDKIAYAKAIPLFVFIILLFAFILKLYL